MSVPVIRRRAWLLAVGCAGSFVALACPRLGEQGAFYDELFQTPAAFAYSTGVVPPMFTADTLFGYPVLNMSYVGAIKSAMFGGWLVVSGQPFDLVAWRLFGIAFVALALACFVLLSYETLTGWGVLAFAALLLSDPAVLLASRHDWGPVALGLAMRLTLIGVWLAGERATRTARRNSLALGLLVGLAVFEKLTSVVLVPALLPLVARRVRRGGVVHLAMLVLGLLIGASPVLVVNWSSWWADGRFVSLDVPAWAGSASPLFDHLRAMSAVGLGTEISGFILGCALPFREGVWRLVPAGVLLVVTCASLRNATRDESFRRAIALLASYGVVVVATDFLPRAAWVHHWLMGTPFQYAGVAGAIAGIRALRVRGLRTATDGMVVVGSALLLVSVQAVNLVEVERALYRGSSSPYWDPSLNRLGEFVAKRVPFAKFIATDWGVGTQIVAFASGSPDAVEEVFWTDRGVARLAEIVNGSRGRELYFVEKLPPLNDAVSRDLVRSVQDGIDRLRCVRELPVESEVTGLAAVALRRFRVVEGCTEG